MTSPDIVLDALGNPTRRYLLACISRGPQSVGQLAATVPVSRPAVSQQLRVLEEAGLIELRRSGRRRVVYLREEGFAAAKSWLSTLWTEALPRFAEARRGEEPGP